MGFSLIPLEPMGKTPLDGFRWKQYHATGTTPEQVTRWKTAHPHCNWGVLLGRPSGLVAVDVDSAAALHWCDSQGGFHRTGAPVWYSTGRGWQYVFRLPDDLKDARGINPYPGVELRCNGQYSVIPPSIHPSGKAYEWRNPPTADNIPMAPAWVCRFLARESEPVALTTQNSKSRQPEKPVRAKHPPNPTTTAPLELSSTNSKLLQIPGTRWMLESVFRKGYRNAALYNLTLILKGAGLSRSEAERQVQQWTQHHTRPTYGRCPDRQREPIDTFRKAWTVPYRLQVERLLSLQTVTGETMPRQWAEKLVAAYPALQAKTQRHYQPLAVSVIKILDALDRNDIRTWTPIPHREMARMAKLSEHQVAKVAGFLHSIGIAKTTRVHSSTTTSYNLQALNCPPTPLISRLARWKGYKLSWRVVAWRLWRHWRTWMKRMFAVLNRVWDAITGVWQGGLTAKTTSAAETAPSRAPPLDSTQTTGLSGPQEADFHAVPRRSVCSV